MEKLWAPWRDEYITNLAKKPKGCVFCRINKEKRDAKNLVFLRSRHCFAVLNLYPYNNGHILILPQRHVGDLSRLAPEESSDFFALLGYAKRLLDEVFAPQGYNIGMNLGKVAGAGEPGHLHFHVVPRWKGDVNFMPVISGTKVISQSLQASYRALVQAHKRLGARPASRRRKPKK